MPHDFSRILYLQIDSNIETSRAFERVQIENGPENKSWVPRVPKLQTSIVTEQ